MKPRLALALFLFSGALIAHPMGNFSVSHYARIEVTSRGANIRYVLDLAEIPTFELLQQWKLEAGSPTAELETRARMQSQDWVRNLAISVDGRSVAPHLERTTLAIDKGAGGMPVMRISSDLKVAMAPGALLYEDRNYAERAGWKEIVIRRGRDAAIERTSHNDVERSQELTAYPQDPTVAPPQDIRASVAWRTASPVVTEKPVITEKHQPTPEVSPQVATAPLATTPVPPQQSAPGTVVRGDFLSQLLHHGEIGWGMMLAGLAVAFGFGAVHALSPGHGKTIVAAYLVGTRGTPKHALFLGAMVTFTHTISVFFLGLTTLFLSQYVVPEKIYPYLGAISGISIVWIGATLLYKRWQKLKGHGHSHPHAHHHHDHDHSHDHKHDHAHAHGLAHDHGDGHVHSHLPEGDVSLASLIALGASGGLVPCPSALVLLLSSIALGRVALGLMLLLAFSAGLAIVLMGIGLVVLFAKHLLPDSRKTAQNPAFRVIPVLSAAIIVFVGLVMTGVSLGVISPNRFWGV